MAYTYGGGCIIGVEVPNAVTIYASDAGLSGKTIQQAQADKVAAGGDATAWPIDDGALTPYYDGTGTSANATSYAAWTSRNLSAIQGYAEGVLVKLKPIDGTCFAGQVAPTWELYGAGGGGSTFSPRSFSVLSVQSVGGEYDEEAYLAPIKTLFCGFPSGQTVPNIAAQCAIDNNYLQTVDKKGALWAEAVQVRLVEPPNNLELASFRYQNNGPTVTQTKTLDGALRSFATGGNAIEIAATFRWSDDGTTAQALNAILKIAVQNNRPLVLWIPQGIYYDGPFLELVVPRTRPLITMPAPGVYELTIEGDCQP